MAVWLCGYGAGVTFVPPPLPPRTPAGRPHRDIGEGGGEEKELGGATQKKPLRFRSHYPAGSEVALTQFSLSGARVDGGEHKENGRCEADRSAGSNCCFTHRFFFFFCLTPVLVPGVTM